MSIRNACAALAVADAPAPREDRGDAVPLATDDDPPDVLDVPVARAEDTVPADIPGGSAVPVTAELTGFVTFPDLRG